MSRSPYAKTEPREGHCCLCNRKFKDVEVILVERRKHAVTGKGHYLYWCRECWNKCGEKSYRASRVIRAEAC